jgi:hypothetical protein
MLLANWSPPEDRFGRWLMDGLRVNQSIWLPVFVLGAAALMLYALSEFPGYLVPERRYLVVVHAVQQGWCAWYDSDEDVLVPQHVARPSSATALAIR